MEIELRDPRGYARHQRPGARRIYQELSTGWIEAASECLTRWDGPKALHRYITPWGISAVGDSKGCRTRVDNGGEAEAHLSSSPVR